MLCYFIHFQFVSTVLKLLVFSITNKGNCTLSRFPCYVDLTWLIPAAVAVGLEHLPQVVPGICLLTLWRSRNVYNIGTGPTLPSSLLL